METTTNDTDTHTSTYRTAISRIHKLLDEAGLNPFDLFSYRFLLDIQGALQENEIMLYSENFFPMIEEAIERKQKALSWKEK